MKKYFPILISKPGELTALRNLTQNVKDEICPVIELLTSHYGSVEEFALTEWSFDNNELFLDISLCDPFDANRVRSLITNLVAGGVNVVPVIQSRSPLRYNTLLQRLIADGIVLSVCIRIGNDRGGFINISNQLLNIMTALGIDRRQVSVLLDFGFVDASNSNLISALAVSSVRQIRGATNYKNIIVASGSFLSNLSSLTPTDRLHRLPRHEWNIWQILLAQPDISRVIKYGDYGTKHPVYSETSFPGSCSIKYTLPNEFIIYRGEISTNHAQGNGQYIIFANRLVNSADYSGSNFSWGDGRILFYSNQVLTDPQRKTGNPKSWVEISQNHHITILHSIL